MDVDPSPSRASVPREIGDRLIIVCLAKVFNQMETMAADPEIKNIYDMNQETVQHVTRTTVHEVSHLRCVWDLVQLAVKRIHEHTTIEDCQKVFLTLLIIGRCFYDRVQMPQDIRGGVVEVTAAGNVARDQRQIDYLTQRLAPVGAGTIPVATGAPPRRGHRPRRSRDSSRGRGGAPRRGG